MPLQAKHLPDALSPDTETRLDWIGRAALRLDQHLERLGSASPSPTLSASQIRALVGQFDFEAPRPVESLVDAAADLLEGGSVHCGHPRYLGLFNPTPAFPGIVADLLTAGYNPNLACWTHAPAAVEIEAHLIRTFCGVFGYGAAAGGHFTSGGTEANATALVCALTRRQPGFAYFGLAGVGPRPALYASADSHLAWMKIAHQCGMGRSAVRLTPTDAAGRLDLAALEQTIASDRSQGLRPVMIVATAGATSSGAIDPLPQIAAIAARENAHFHIDAAWGGAAALSASLRSNLAGVELADSLTVDAHKWLAAPMGAGMFFCRDGGLLGEAFDVSASYMPPGATDLDGYTHSMQWSRRFIGLKLFFILGALGLEGYARMVDGQALRGEQLRARLRARGWRIVNETPLPVVLFEREGVDSARLADAMVASREAWLSSTSFAGRTVLRACISSFATSEDDLDRVTERLDRLAADCTVQ